MRLKKERVNRKKLGNLTLIADKVNIVSPSGQAIGPRIGGGVQAPKRQYQFSYNVDQQSPSVTSGADTVTPSAPGPEPPNPVQNALGRIGSMLGNAAMAYVGQAIGNRVATEFENWMFNSSTNPNVPDDLVWTPMSQGISPGTTASSGTTYVPPPSPRTQRREQLAGAAEGRQADQYLQQAEDLMRRPRVLPPPIDTGSPTSTGTYVTASPNAHYSPSSSIPQSLTPSTPTIPNMPSPPGTSPAGSLPSMPSPPGGSPRSPDIPYMPPPPTGSIGSSPTGSSPGTATVAGETYPATSVGTPTSASSIGSLRYPGISPPSTPGSVNYPGMSPVSPPGSVNYPSPGTSPGTATYPSVGGSPVGSPEVNLASPGALVPYLRAPPGTESLQEGPRDAVYEANVAARQAYRQPATQEQMIRMVSDLNARANQSYNAGQRSFTRGEEAPWPEEILAQVTRENLPDFISSLSPADIPFLAPELIQEFFPAYTNLPMYPYAHNYPWEPEPPSPGWSIHTPSSGSPMSIDSMRRSSGSSRRMSIDSPAAGGTFRHQMATQPLTISTGGMNPMQSYQHPGAGETVPFIQGDAWIPLRRSVRLQGPQTTALERMGRRMGRRRGR